MLIVIIRRDSIYKRLFFWKTLLLNMFFLRNKNILLILPTSKPWFNFVLRVVDVVNTCTCDKNVIASPYFICFTYNFKRSHLFLVTYKFSLSRNKRMVMIVNGYKFSLHYSRNSKERWQCSRRSYFGCKAVIHTSAGVILYSNTAHNHGPWTTKLPLQQFFKTILVKMGFGNLWY